MKEKHKSARRKRVLLVFGAVAIGICSLLFIFHVIENRVNQDNAYRTLSVLVDQFEQILDNNEERSNVLTQSLKESYISRARSVAYIFDKNPEMAGNLSEIKEVAQYLSIDEIHIFDASGTIIGGTVPKYYGYSFDSGEQMGYFKPMLNDKTLAMCQDITPNTAEEKPMMYAICWNGDGTKMIQVGIEPIRLLKELNDISIPEVVSSLGLYDGVNMFVADKETGKILGSNLSAGEWETLSRLGIKVDADAATANIQTGETTVNGEPSYMAAHVHGPNIIVCTQSVAVANAGIDTTLSLVFVYLVAAALVTVFISHRMTKEIIEERRIATEDSLTALGNRRAYDKEIERLKSTQLAEDFVYVLLDVNGLKVTNDTLGHEMGDKLIRGCSSCALACLGDYGSLFRIGGDEFAALIYAGEDELKRMARDFEKAQEAWSAENDLELSVSLGLASVKRHPGATVMELAHIADANMYESKKRHYENT